MSNLEVRFSDDGQPQRCVDYLVGKLTLLNIAPDLYRIEHRVINHPNTDGKLIFGQYGQVVLIFREENDFNIFEESLGLHWSLHG